MTPTNRDVRCCICDDPLEPPYRLILGRPYCERHYEVVNRPHDSFWRASLYQIVGMAIFSAVIALLGRQLPLENDAVRIGVGLFLAIVPTALWLFFFYRQDRLEPEPKTRIALTFFTSLALAQLIALPLIRNVFHYVDWVPTANWPVSLAAAILIQGFLWQASAYAGVRTVYASAEFDERMDGVIYGTTAGLGVATLLNLRYIIDNAGVEITPGVINTVTTALAQASFGGLMGYFMAEAKFAHRPLWWVPLGFALAAVGNGLFSWLTDEVSATGLSVDPWRSLILGVVLALAAFALLIALMSRNIQVTMRQVRR
jgi:RsiW-degrading membrane proteinase PrsW (M82 family)